MHISKCQSWGTFLTTMERVTYVTRSEKGDICHKNLKLSFIYGWIAHNISFNLVLQFYTSTCTSEDCHSHPYNFIHSTNAHCELVC